MKNFTRLRQGVDVMPLLLAIKRKPELWQADTYLRDYPQGPFKQVQSIILRFPPRYIAKDAKDLADYESRTDQHENVDQPVYANLPQARPLVSGLMAAVEGERLGRVILNKIVPGGRIFPHRDTPAHAQYWDRFHIVLDSSPGNNFTCGEAGEVEQVYMAPGEVWWFQNAKMHEVINNGNRDRIHMVVDIRTPQ